VCEGMQVKSEPNKNLPALGYAFFYTFSTHALRDEGLYT
jgi:hypothetical protein